MPVKFMRILFIDSIYSRLLADVNHKLTRSSTYIENLKKVSDLRFGTSSHYSKAFNELGWESKHLYLNIENLQLSYSNKNRKTSHLIWEKHNHLVRLNLSSLRFLSINEPYNIIEKQILDFKPNIIVVQDIAAFSPKFINYLKLFCNIVAGEIASNLPPKPYLLAYDCLFSASPNLVNNFRKLGIISFYLPLAFESSILNEVSKSLGPRRPDIDISFVGSITNHSSNTLGLLKHVANRTNRFRIYGFADVKILKKYSLEKYYHGQAWGIDMYKILYRSKISLNRHINMAGDFAANLRLFESTGMGAYLLTDYKPNIDLLFPNQFISSYRNYNDIDKFIDFALNNTEQIRNLAKKAQSHTLNFHNYRIRAESMIRDFASVGRKAH